MERRSGSQHIHTVGAISGSRITGTIHLMKLPFELRQSRTRAEVRGTTVYASAILPR